MMVLKYFIGYKEHEILKPLCIILPQMTGYIKHLKTEEKPCPLWLKLTICWINTIKFGTRLKES